MKIDKTFKRRIRIVSKPFALVGCMVKVADVHTGEDIENIYHIEITLDARELNQAVIFYHPCDVEGKMLLDENHDPREETVTVKDPEIDIMALEVNNLTEGEG